MRRPTTALASVAVGLVAILLVPAAAQAQSHGRMCRTADTGYIYTIRTLAGDSRQHDIDVYFNSARAAFLVLVFDSDTDVVLSTSSGLQSNDRFVHGSLRLLPRETYRIAVGCVLANAAYRLSVKRGEEIRLPAPRVLGAHAGLTAAQASDDLALEAAVIEERLRLLAVQ